MKAVVLAAGKGSRLGGVTASVPKPMLPVRGRPVLEHNIRWLAEWGVRDLYLNLHHLPDVIENHFGDGERFGVRIRYSRETELLGTAGAVGRIADTWWQAGDAEPFLVVYGDNLLTYDLGAVRRFFTERPGAAGVIVVYPKEDVSLSGIVVTGADDRIQRFIEKPAPAERISHLVNTGLYLLSADTLAYIPRDRPQDYGHDIFPRMVADGAPLYACQCPGTLTAIDTPELWRNAAGGQVTP